MSCNGENELFHVKSFIILLSTEGSSFFNIDNSAIFSNEKKYIEAFWGVYFNLWEYAKELLVKSRPRI